MAQKDASFFVNKIYQNKDFHQSFIQAKCDSFDAIQQFAVQHQFDFTKDELIEAYKLNYKYRWAMFSNKK
jgi:hypothetical protein